MVGHVGWEPRAGKCQATRCCHQRPQVFQRDEAAASGRQHRPATRDDHEAARQQEGQETHVEASAAVNCGGKQTIEDVRTKNKTKQFLGDY